jgi:hypothetical protein
MDRLSRLLAALRVCLVALGVCLLGRETLGPVVQTAFDAASAHARSADVPDPPAVAELRDEDPRGGSEDDDLDHRAAPALAPPAAPLRRTQPIRGPPAGSHAVPWRPRSSRGPPAQA